MLNEPAALTAAHLPDMIALPRTEADLLLAVFRAARKYLNISRGIARGDAIKARRKLLDLVKDGGDPAKLAVTALIDGGSSDSIVSDVVKADREFKIPATVLTGADIDATRRYGRNFPYVLEKFSTNKAIANALGVAPVTVAIWKQRGNIPHKYWLALSEFASEQGIEGLSLEDLHQADGDERAA